MRLIEHFHTGSHSFNMTAVIDIVFLLIIFFLVVCRFIEAENLPVDVPAGCEFAQNDAERQARLTTVTVMKTAEGRADFAVGAEKIAVSDYTSIVDKAAELINARLTNLPVDRKVVTLRIDKDVCFSQAQYALAAVAASAATDIRLAVFGNESSNNR